MAGIKHTSKTLNNTLLFIIKLLNDNKIKNWFIAYGTLLGIIRDNSCIEGDDDVDIIIDISNYRKLLKILHKNKILINKSVVRHLIKFSHKPYVPHLIKTCGTKNYSSIDFYMADVFDKEGNFYDKWEKVLWSCCYNSEYSLIEYIWNNNKLYLPFNYKQKLINRYGKTWTIPLDTKGVKPKKRKL